MHCIYFIYINIFVIYLYFSREYREIWKYNAGKLTFKNFTFENKVTFHLSCNEMHRWTRKFANNGRIYEQKQRCKQCTDANNISFLTVKQWLVLLNSTNSLWTTRSSIYYSTKMQGHANRYYEPANFTLCVYTK